MKALWVLIKAQFKNKKSNYISIFFIALLIGLLLSLSVSMIVNVNNTATDAAKASNIGDYFMMFVVNYVPTDEDFENLNQMEEIKSIRVPEKVRVIGEYGNINKKDNEKISLEKDPAFYAYRSDFMPFRILSEDKKSYLPPDQVKAPEKGEAYVPISFIAQFGVEIGDTYHLKTAEEDFKFKISGLVEDLTQTNMISIGEHNIYLNESDFNLLKQVSKKNPEQFHFNYMVYFDVNEEFETVPMNEMFKRVQEKTGLRDKAIFSGTDDLLIFFASIISYIIIFAILIFIIIMFIASLLISNFSVASSIEEEYKNIGVLKAIGLKNRSFNLVYIFSYISAMILGFVVGLLLSIPLYNMVTPYLFDVTSMLATNQIVILPTLIGFLIFVLIMLVFLLIQLRKIGKIVPAKALREGKQANYSSSGVKIKLSKPVLNLKLSIKQFTSSAKSYIGSTFVVAFLFFFVLVSLSLTTVMTPDRMMTEFWGFDWDLITIYDSHEEYEENNQQIRKIIEEDVEINDSYLVYQLPISTLDQNVGAFILEEKDMDQMTSILAGRAPQDDAEVAITKILADNAQIQIGDSIEVKYNDNTADFVVTGLFQTINQAGQAVTFADSVIEKLAISDKNLYIQEYYIIDNQDKGKDIAKNINEQLPDIEVQNVVEMWESYGLMAAGFDYLAVLILVLSIVFAIISSFILAEKIFSKEEADFGVLKAIGIKVSSIRRIFSLRFILIGLLGLILGFLLFLFTGNSILSNMSLLLGLSQIRVILPKSLVIITSLLLVFAFWLIAHFVSRKVKKLDVRNLINEI
ncbi:MAG: ABC transporter permease [Clostridiaceae bacterium]|nr:ABC transporter permease [Clostridiaceae bacterium]